MTYGQGLAETIFRLIPIKPRPAADNPEGMVAFSSRGPDDDGRIKPDVVAPGSFILQPAPAPRNRRDGALSSDPLYMFEGGTSMATPLVAGCVAGSALFSE